MEETSAVCFLSPFCVGMCESFGDECHEYVELHPSIMSLSGKLRPTSELHPSSTATEPLPYPASFDERKVDSKKSLLTTQRFSFASSEQLSELSKGHIPENTLKSTKWALKVFDQWKEVRNQSYPHNPVPDDLLLSNDTAVLNTYLSRFAVEARKVTGEHYPPSTIHQLLCGLLRHMRETNPGCPNFLNK